jgi:hypothetical protein
MPKSQPLLIPLSDALAAIREEPDLHKGGMSDELWNEMRGSREMAEIALRMAVKQTKRGILDRLKEKAQHSATVSHGQN